MTLNILSSFIDFKKTKEGRKLDKEEVSPLQIRLTRAKRFNSDKIDVNIVFNKELIASMKENGINRFKLMFDEGKNQIAIVYCTLPEAFDLGNKKIKATGSIQFNDKYVSATMSKLLLEKGATSFLYNGTFIKESSAYIFRLYKTAKEK